jgi:2-C-methyl-D-erythritol 4-phosphate cytidylyltransferase
VNIVVVHDAARPFVPAEVIDRVITEARKGHGAVPGMPVVDTIKRASDEGRIVETVDRHGLWRIQTPQAFPREMIQKAHVDAREANIQATDDAALCERLGLEVVIVPGSERAMKITHDADFARAEALAILPP